MPEKKKKTSKKTTPKKKSCGKSCTKKNCNKTSASEPVNFKVDVPSDHTILDRLRTIRDKVFASFGIGSNISND